MNKEAKPKIPVGPSAIKELSNKGKKVLFEAIDDYIDAKIKYHVHKIIVKYHANAADISFKEFQELAREAVEEVDLAKKTLKEMIDALEIRLE